MPKYPETPMLNCLYCKWYNEPSNSCTHKNAMQIASFHRKMDKDCVLLTYDKSETPESPDKDFANKFCIGKKCPYFYASKRLCTRPSLCPYKNEDEETIFTNITLLKPD